MKTPIKLLSIAFFALIIVSCEKDKKYTEVYNQLPTDLQPFLWTDLPINYTGQEIINSNSTSYTLNSSHVTGKVETKVYSEYVKTDASDKIYNVVGYSDYTFNHAAFSNLVELSVKNNIAKISIFYVVVSATRGYTLSYVISIKDSDLVSNLTIGGINYQNVYSYSLAQPSPYKKIILSKDKGIISITNWQNQVLQIN